MSWCSLQVMDSMERGHSLLLCGAMISGYAGVRLVSSFILIAFLFQIDYWIIYEPGDRLSRVGIAQFYPLPNARAAFVGRYIKALDL